MTRFCFLVVLFSLAGAIIRYVTVFAVFLFESHPMNLPHLRRSPKFFRKIQYIPTLSMLAQYVPLTEIDIAPAVYQ
jgi:hypothetical protein